MQLSVFGTDIVTIYVGPKRKAFVFHKKLLCDRSDFFSKIFNSGSKESIEEVMFLSAEKPEIFDSMVNFIYRDTLPIFPSKEYSDIDHANQKYCTQMFHLFALAEKLCINGLANKVMDRIQDVFLLKKILCNHESLGLIYLITHEGSKLRLYASASILTHSTFNLTGLSRVVMSQNPDQYASVPGFTRDFFLFHFKHGNAISSGTDYRKREDRKGLGRCYFHTHAKGEICHLEGLVCQEGKKQR